MTTRRQRPPGAPAPGQPPQGVPAKMAHLDRLGPSVDSVMHMAWPVPEGLSSDPNKTITAIVLRELDGNDDLIIAMRQDPANPMSELHESIRQAIVAYSRQPVPTIPVVDQDGDQIGFEWRLDQVGPDFWTFVAEGPTVGWKGYDGLSLMCRRFITALYRQINTLDMVMAGKALTSGRVWSPTTRRTNEPATSPSAHSSDGSAPSSDG